MSQLTEESIKNHIAQFRHVRDFYANNQIEKAKSLTIEILEQPLSEDAAVGFFCRLANSFVISPIVGMKSLMALVYLRSFDGQLSKVVKDQVLGVKQKDNETLHNSVPEITFDPNVSIEDFANSWYEIVISSYATLSPQQYEKFISQYVKVLNILFGNGVGDRALIAAQNAVNASSGTTLLTYMGCKNGLFEGATEQQCNNSEAAVKQLLDALPEFNF